jgi:hypothetical protein
VLVVKSALLKILLTLIVLKEYSSVSLWKQVSSTNTARPTIAMRISARPTRSARNELQDPESSKRFPLMRRSRQREIPGRRLSPVRIAFTT